MRVLIAEDHFVTRSGLKAILGSEPDVFVVAEAGTGAQAIALFRTHRPDVAIVDLKLPDMSGVDVIKAIRGEFEDARVAVLTASEGSELVYRAMEAGARAYLLKDASGSELIRALRDVMAGRRVMSPGVAEQLAERLPQSALTPREIDVLRSARTWATSSRSSGPTIGHRRPPKPSAAGFCNVMSVRDADSHNGHRRASAELRRHRAR
jgi:DNA-binding NarL/FixJ family response regulator